MEQANVLVLSRRADDAVHTVSTLETRQCVFGRRPYARNTQARLLSNPHGDGRRSQPILEIRRN